VATSIAEEADVDGLVLPQGVVNIERNDKVDDDDDDDDDDDIAEVGLLVVQSIGFPRLRVEDD